MLPTGRLLSRAAARLFRHIEVDEDWRVAVEAVSQRGAVVYVLRHVSMIDYLALEHLTRRFGLPPIGFASALPAALAPNRSRPGQSATELLEHAVTSGHAAVLFVNRAPHRGAVAVRQPHDGAKLLAALLRLQASDTSREVIMMPQTFVWTQRPERRGFSIADTLLGPADYPGELRMVGQFLLNYRNCRLRAGEPLSLRDFLAQQDDQAHPDSLVRRLTYALLRKVERERRIIVGPAQKAPDRVREEVLRSPKLQRVIREMAGPRRQERALLTGKAREMLRRMQAICDPEVQSSIELLAKTTLEHIFSGIDIDRTGIDRLRELQGRGSVVLLPSHKSHVDYVVLSHMLRESGFQLPVIAAGDNLSFFPAGPLLRRGGAFFIKRHFRGDRLYTAVVDAYMRRLIRDGWTLEFFLEGGRSRTGKLMPPMLGLLNMVVQSALGLGGRPIYFQPVSIGYERFMEEGAFARELSGQQKQREDAAALLKLRSVLADRWGRINIQFGQPIEIGELTASLGIDAGHITPASRRRVVKRLAHATMSEINRVTAITPGALVSLILLSRGRRGVSHRELKAHARRLLAMLLRLGARATQSAVEPAQTTLREEGIRDVLKLYLRSGLIAQHLPGDTLTAEGRKRAARYIGADAIFTVPDAKRLRLDLAKNQIVHWLVDRSLIAVALLSNGREGDEPGPASEPALDESALRARVQSLSRLFKYEFTFRTDVPFDEVFDQVLDDMIATGELQRDDGRLRLGPGHDGLNGRGWLTFHAAVMRNFIESYRIAAHSLSSLLKGPIDRKELVARALRSGERMFLEGEIERSEAVCRPVIDHALSALTDLGYLTREADVLGLADTFRSEAGAHAIETRIAVYLHPRAADDPWG